MEIGMPEQKSVDKTDPPDDEGAADHGKRIGQCEQKLEHHHDRLKMIEHHLGIKHPADGMKSEDPDGKKKPNYERRRH
jgi:hypothetical protein